MNIDINDIGNQMIKAIESAIGKNWPATQIYFESESKAFAARLATIVQLRVERLISEERARQHLQFLKVSWETFLLAIEGLNQLMIENSLNAALAVIKSTVNKAIGFALL